MRAGLPLGRCCLEVCTSAQAAVVLSWGVLSGPLGPLGPRLEMLQQLRQPVLPLLPRSGKCDRATTAAASPLC